MQFNDRPTSAKVSVLARTQNKRLDRKVPRTQEWAEQNYYKVRATANSGDRVPPNEFWRDIANGETLPASLLGAHRSFTEIMAALALVDFPFKASEVTEDRKEAWLSLTFGGRVTVTDPTSSRRRLNVLLQIPRGVVPMGNGF